MLKELYSAVIDAAIFCVENAAHLPDGVSQIPSDLVDALGDAIVRMTEEEGNLLLDTDHFANNPIEPVIQACDHFYLAFFDEVVVPGGIYIISKEKDEGVRYIHTAELLSFTETVKEHKRAISRL